MRGRKKIEPVLAYWTVDASTWREFVRDVRALQQQPHAPWCPLKLQEAPAAPVEVVVREDSVSVGKEKLEFLYQESLQVTLRDSWLEFGSHPSDRESHYLFPVPVTPSARADAARVADQINARIAERTRSYQEERTRPTPSNRLLTWVESHFALAMLLFFFVLIPALVGFLTLLSHWFPSFKLIRDG